MTSVSTVTIHAVHARACTLIVGVLMYTHTSVVKAQRSTDETMCSIHMKSMTRFLVTDIVRGPINRCTHTHVWTSLHPNSIYVFLLCTLTAIDTHFVTFHPIMPML